MQGDTLSEAIMLCSQGNHREEYGKGDWGLYPNSCFRDETKRVGNKCPGRSTIWLCLLKARLSSHLYWRFSLWYFIMKNLKRAAELGVLPRTPKYPPPKVYVVLCTCCVTSRELPPPVLILWCISESMFLSFFFLVNVYLLAFLNDKSNACANV